MLRYLLLAFLAVGFGCKKSAPDTASTALDEALVAAKPDLSPFKDPQIAYWEGPPKAHNNRETWQRIKDVGYTVVMPGSDYGEEDLVKMLGFTDELGLNALVMDHRINIRLSNEPDWQQQLAGFLAPYKSYKSFYGVILRDEPSAAEFGNIATVKEEILRQAPNLLVFVNLNPVYATPDALGLLSYNEYVESYLSTVRPQVFSHDNYTLYNETRGSKDRDDFIANLEVIGRLSRLYDIPAWSTFLSSSTTNHRVPNLGEMRWQSYLSLAYGMTGLMHWYYWPGIYDAGMVDEQTGAPTPQYEVVRQVNAETMTYARALSGLKHVDVMYPGRPPLGGLHLTRNFPIEFARGTNIALALFRREGQPGYYMFVVNLSHAQSQQVSASAAGGLEVIRTFDPSQSQYQPFPMQNNQIQFDLPAGGAQLFYVETFVSEPTFTFDQGDDGWKQGRGGSYVEDFAHENGALVGKVAGEWAYLLRDHLYVKLGDFQAVELSMKLPQGKTAQFFWATPDNSEFTHDRSVEIPLKGTGEMETYRVPLPEKYHQDVATRFRLSFDKSGQAVGQRFVLDALKLVP